MLCRSIRICAAREVPKSTNYGWPTLRLFAFAMEFVYLAVVLDAYSRRVIAGTWADAGG